MGVVIKMSKRIVSIGRLYGYVQYKILFDIEFNPAIPIWYSRIYEKSWYKGVKK